MHDLFGLLTCLETVLVLLVRVESYLKLQFLKASDLFLQTNILSGHVGVLERGKG